MAYGVLKLPELLFRRAHVGAEHRLVLARERVAKAVLLKA